LPEAQLIEYIGTIDFKFKYFIIPDDKLYFVDKDKTTLTYVTNFDFPPQFLFNKYIFRIPTINAHNIKLDFQESIIIPPNNKHTFAPVSKISETDEYLEVCYIFWNNELVNEISDSDALVKLNPDYTYSFITKFSLQYETFRVEWLIAIILSSLVAILGFIGGALWAKKAK